MRAQFLAIGSNATRPDSITSLIRRGGPGEKSGARKTVVEFQARMKIAKGCREHRVSAAKLYFSARVCELGLPSTVQKLTSIRFT